MSSDVETLMEMGFTKNRAEKALHTTGFKGVQNAMDWLFAHEDDADIDDEFVAPPGQALGSAAATSPGSSSTEKPVEVQAQEEPMNSQTEDEKGAGEAKSLKCEDCGKLLKDMDAAEFHAAKTGHANFAESTEEKKPLTAEEKEEQKAKLQEKLKQKRIEKQEQEKKERIEQEKMRRMRGKDMSEAKQRHEELEMKKILEQRKREKREEKLAKQKVRDAIERDKLDRAAKFAKSATSPTAAAAPEVSPVAVAPQPTEKKEYDECRIQIRLTNGQSLTQSFGAKEPLAAVRLYIEMNRSDGDGNFSLMTSFPRKVFTDTDMEKPLTELGLVPSAVLIVTRK